MRISDIRLTPVTPTAKGLVAFCSLTFNQELILNSIAVYMRPDGSGIRLVYPRTTLVNGKVIQNFYPANAEIAKTLEQVVFNEYKKVFDYFINRNEGVANV